MSPILLYQKSNRRKPACPPPAKSERPDSIFGGFDIQVLFTFENLNNRRGNGGEPPEMPGIE
jgi:hypothetical protein